VKQQIVFLMTPDSAIDCAEIRCNECAFGQRFAPEYYMCFNRDKLMHSMMNSVFSQKKESSQKKHIGSAS
jgi:hypothetical protein